eukprot:TRINITY_DN2982_c1_g1_i1.p1 TRINITY_DN2982_c1_g1~~TRINITY_DN2982_c1_g1_i1.p1  ORF type:complete len:315 (-),score=121.68 TRINITY_DN2982_c1_g1_i1:206-1150(-)
MGDTFNDTISLISDVLLIISIICATCTIITFLIFGDIRTYPIKLILYLCVCIVIGFTSFVISSESFVTDNGWLCIIIAISVHGFFIANFCWTFCIAFNFYQMIVRRNRDSQKLELWYHVFSWGLPIVLCVAVGAAQKYGKIEGDPDVCYINNNWARFICFFLPGLIIIAANAVLFFFVGREIHETLSGAPKADQRDRKKEFRVYISIYVSIGLSWIFGYLMFIIPQETVQAIFLVLFTVFTPLQGALIFLFYCINKKVGSKWAGLFGKCIPPCADLAAKMSNSSATGSARSHGSGSSGGSSSRGADSASSASSI